MKGESKETIMMNTSELVLKARQGDMAAFSDLMKACQERLFRIAYSYVKNRDDALDIVSETVYRAYVNLGSLKNSSYFDTWIVRIAINVSITFINKNRRIDLRENMEFNPAEYPLSKTDEIMDLHSAMDRLNENQKAVIILKYFEDLPITQVAEILERPVGTVKTYLHSALKKLRLELKEAF